MSRRDAVEEHPFLWGLGIFSLWRPSFSLQGHRQQAGDMGQGSAGQGTEQDGWHCYGDMFLSLSPPGIAEQSLVVVWSVSSERRS